jgi:hypothetical protein
LRLLFLLTLFFLPCLAYSQSFEEKLDQAITPLLTLPIPQKEQLITILTLYNSEFQTINLQLDGLSTDLKEERVKHKAEVDQVIQEKWTAIIEVGIAAGLLGLIAGLLVPN